MDVKSGRVGDEAKTRKSPAESGRVGVTAVGLVGGEYTVLILRILSGECAWNLNPWLSSTSICLPNNVHLKFCHQINYEQEHYIF